MHADDDGDGDGNGGDNDDDDCCCYITCRSTNIVQLV